MVSAQDKILGMISSRKPESHPFWHVKDQTVICD